MLDAIIKLCRSFDAIYMITCNVNVPHPLMGITVFWNVTFRNASLIFWGFDTQREAKWVAAVIAIILTFSAPSLSVK